jgi:hypothetical protein
VKDKYFGDVNDFRKYGLLRLLTASGSLRIGVCWMLTEPDGRSDGNFLGYLAKPKEYNHRDPELFSWLNQVVEVDRERRTARIEGTGLLGSASFHSAILTDRQSELDEYFAQCMARFVGCDLIFFDPDNGLEVKSKRLGRKHSCKFLYWHEVHNSFAAGSSVLIYQHFPRVERTGFIKRMTDELQRRTGAAEVFAFRTPHAVFLLAAQERHAMGFRRQFPAIQSRWGPKELVAEATLIAK